MKKTFQCHPWLKNPNLQTIWPNYFRKQPKLALKTRRIILPDGDFLDLNLLHEPLQRSKVKGLVFILHGLGGSIDSHYSRSLMNAMRMNNLEPVFVHFRGSSGEPNEKPFSYHAGKADDIAFVIETISRENPGQKYFAIGISIGGSMLINYLGNYKTVNPLTAAVAVSTPYDLYETAMFLDQGFSKKYQTHMMKSLKQDLKNKFSTMNSPIDLEKAICSKNLYDFDNVVTAPLNGFDGVMDYYTKCSAKQYLCTIQTPTLLIHAKDDPFMSPTSIPLASELNEMVDLELYEKGGHVGFVESTRFWQPSYYLERRIPAYFNAFCE